MAGSRRHAVRAAFTFAALLAFWLLTTEPWGLGMLQAATPTGIVTTNTIAHPTNRIDVLSAVADAVRARL
jgi:hypothetical protein